MSHPDEDAALVSKPRVANPFNKGRKGHREGKTKKWKRKEIRKDERETNVTSVLSPVLIIFRL
jgi:hypothetical protein